MRRSHALEELSALGLEGEFVQGLLTGDQELDELYSQKKNLFLAKRSLTPGEIATYAGHRKIWKRIVDDGCECALVFEDDFGVIDRERFAKSVRDCLDNMGNWDIIKFFDFKPKRVMKRRKLGETDLVAYKYPASGAVAYLITGKAAQRLLGRSRIFRPIDEDFSWPWEFRLRIWSVCPNLVQEVSYRLGGSHLEQTRITNKSGRNVARRIWANVLQSWKLTRSYIFLLAGR